jgi:ABC-type uncharacterized transport system involved in gliding motility auxiliary subunit
MMVHPKQLPPKTLYAIDQFVMRGGRMLLFVDPNSGADTSGARTRRIHGRRHGRIIPRTWSRCSRPGASTTIRPR